MSSRNSTGGVTCVRSRSRFSAEDSQHSPPSGDSCPGEAGFRLIRESKHVIMSDGRRVLTIPRADPINAFTMGGIARDAGSSVEQFRDLP